MNRQGKRVAALAHIYLKEEEEAYYERQFDAIMTEIEKINEVPIHLDKDPLIVPTEEHDRYQEEEVHMIDKKEMMKNAKQKNESYLIVPRVLND